MSIPIPRQHIEKEIVKYSTSIKRKRKRTDEPPKKIITISRQLGSGGRKIAEEVGKKLNCTVWDREILDVLSNQSQWDYQARMFEALDEKSQNAIEALIAEFFGRVEKHTYMYLLPKAIYVIAQNDAIILGRGAHVLLSDSFRVRIKASLETRIYNMMRHEGLDEKKAKAQIKKIDRQRDDFCKQLSKKTGVKDYVSRFDLEINTDKYDIKDATSIIMHGFALYYHALKRSRK